MHYFLFLISVGVVGGPECGQLPVDAGVGHNERHGAGERDACQDACTNGGSSHHAGYRSKLSFHRSEKEKMVREDRAGMSCR